VRWLGWWVDEYGYVLSVGGRGWFSAVVWLLFVGWL